MPQESRRSTGYRSFITCNDPRGVVECGTIRKSKITRTQEGEYEKKLESHRRKQKNLNVPGGGELSSKEMDTGGGFVVRKGGEQSQSSTSFHLSDVSRGAQKLNHVISSWSDGQYKNSSRDMAKDLLKGALDLGESLGMFSRLQHSSSYTSGSSKKQQKLKTDRGGFEDDLEIKGKDSIGLRDEMQDIRSRGHHLSGSSRGSFEEIKKVIQDDFGRKNVFSDPSSEEACDDRRLDSSDVPSTSSSQSSIVHSSNFVSPESLLSSTASQKKNKKPKGFNLMAKLMGLEDASLKSPRKYFREGEKIVNQKKPAFDLDSPRARNYEHDPQKSGWKRWTLDQMIEAMKFKGLPKNSMVNGVKSSPSSHHSEFSHTKQRWGSVDSDDRPPIVIMRPLRFSCLNVEHPIIPKSRAEVDEQMMLLKMRIRTNPLAQTDLSETSSFHENFRKAMLDEAPIKNSSQGEGCFDRTLVKEKTEVKEAKASEKASSNGISRPHKKQLVKKNAEEAQKLTGSRRKGEMKRTTKSESHLQSQDGDNLTTLMVKSSRGMNNTEIDMLRSATDKYGKQGTKGSSNSKKHCPENVKKVIKEAVQIVNGNQRYRDENGEVGSMCEGESRFLLENSTRLTEDASQIEITDYVDDGQSSPGETPLLSSSRRNTLTALIRNEWGTTDHDKESQCSTSDYRAVEGGVLFSEDEKQHFSVCCTNLQNAHEMETVDFDRHANDILNPFSGDIASLSISQSGATSHIMENENSTPSIDHNGSGKGSAGENTMKALLLSSPLFVNHVEELFDLKVNPDLAFLQQIDNDIDHNDLSTRMLLDFATEFMELHSSQCSTACLPSPGKNKMCSISYYYTSLNQLLDEVCCGFEALKCYTKPDGNIHSTDSLLLLVKEDLRDRGIVTGMWDFGWTSAGSADEIGEITRGVDELILDGLIEEILVDLTL